MQDRDLVKQAWSETGLYVSDDPKLSAFLQHFEKAMFGCWPDLVPEVREHYSEYKEQLLIPIWDTGDKLLRLNVIRALAPDRDDEVQIFQRIARRPNRRGRDWELQALMRVAKRRGFAVE